MPELPWTTVMYVHLICLPWKPEKLYLDHGAVFGDTTLRCLSCLIPGMPDGPQSASVLAQAWIYTRITFVHFGSLGNPT